MKAENEMTASEALFAFTGWLTTREEKTVLSSSNDAAPVAELVNQFIVANSLKFPDPDWSTKCINFPED